MSEQTLELFPCPFCGGVGAINCKPERKGFTYYAFCSNCLCCTDYQINPQKAKEAWNTRTRDNAQQQVQPDNGVKVETGEVDCPCNCENGKSFNNSTGSEKTCTVCEGKGKLTYSRAKKLNLDYLFRAIN